MEGWEGGIRWSDRDNEGSRWVWHADIRWLNAACSLEEGLGGEHSCSSGARSGPALDWLTQRNSGPHMGIWVPRGTDMIPCVRSQREFVPFMPHCQSILSVTGNSTRTHTHSRRFKKKKNLKKDLRFRHPPTLENKEVLVTKT